MQFFTHPTPNQLSLLAEEHFLWDPTTIGQKAGHLSDEVPTSELQPGDYIENEGSWLMVTMYNGDGFGEVFVVTLRDDSARSGKSWHHTWMMWHQHDLVRRVRRVGGS